MAPIAAPLGPASAVAAAAAAAVSSTSTASSAPVTQAPAAVSAVVSTKALHHQEANKVRRMLDLHKTTIERLLALGTWPSSTLEAQLIAVQELVINYRLESRENGLLTEWYQRIAGWWQAYGAMERQQTRRALGSGGVSSSSSSGSSKASSVGSNVGVWGSSDRSSSDGHLSSFSGSFGAAARSDASSVSPPPLDSASDRASSTSSGVSSSSTGGGHQRGRRRGHFTSPTSSVTSSGGTDIYSIVSNCSSTDSKEIRGSRSRPFARGQPEKMAASAAGGSTISCCPKVIPLSEIQLINKDPALAKDLATLDGTEWTNEIDFLRAVLTIFFRAKSLNTAEQDQLWDVLFPRLPAHLQASFHAKYGPDVKSNALLVPVLIGRYCSDTSVQQEQREFREKMEISFAEFEMPKGEPGDSPRQVLQAGLKAILQLITKNVECAFQGTVPFFGVHHTRLLDRIVELTLGKMPPELVDAFWVHMRDAKSGKSLLELRKFIANHLDRLAKELGSKPVPGASQMKAQQDKQKKEEEQSDAELNDKKDPPEPEAKESSDKETRLTWAAELKQQLSEIAAPATPTDAAAAKPDHETLRRLFTIVNRSRVGLRQFCSKTPAGATPEEVEIFQIAFAKMPQAMRDKYLSAFHAQNSLLSLSQFLVGEVLRMSGDADEEDVEKAEAKAEEEEMKKKADVKADVSGA